MQKKGNKRQGVTKSPMDDLAILEALPYVVELRHLVDGFAHYKQPRKKTFDLVRLDLMYFDSKVNDQKLEKEKKRGPLISREDVLRLLETRFSSVDFEKAKQDVVNFIPNGSELEAWSKEYFLAAAEQLRVTRGEREPLSD